MHELGILVHILRTVQEAAEENHVTRVEKICLDVGEVCGVIPRYMEMQLPIAARGNPLFEDCELSIHVVKARGRCLRCGRVYLLTAHKGICPQCHYDDFCTTEGTELMIRDIIVSGGDFDDSEEDNDSQAGECI